MENLGKIEYLRNQKLNMMKDERDRLVNNDFYVTSKQISLRLSPNSSFLIKEPKLPNFDEITEKIERIEKYHLNKSDYKNQKQEKQKLIQNERRNKVYIIHHHPVILI